MSCFPCFQSQKGKKANRSHHGNVERSVQSSESKAPESRKPKSIAASESKMEVTPQTQPQPKPKPQPQPQSQPQQEAENSNINAQTFTFRELATATKNFRQECLLGEGGFGRVYKGTLQSTNKVVAVKQLDRNGLQGNKEFLVEVLMLSLLHHQNLVSLLGYCADGDQRLLVYEFMPGGSVEDHLLEITEKQKPLDWMTRVKIALGAAQGLEYLHDKANPPVIYRDLKSSNILLDENFVPKLSDFGLAKLGPLGDKMHVSSRVMGTYGYCAPEYERTGHLSVKSDVYSFGVVLLELITGRRVIDNTRPVDEQNLIAWAQPIFRDPKKYPNMADPLLKKRFSEKGLNQAVAIAAMCLQEEAAARPLMSDVVTALTFLSKDADDIPLPRNPLSRHDGETEDDEKNTDEEDECSDEYDEDGSCYDEEENEQVENATKAGTSSNQQDKDSSVIEDQVKEGKKDEIRKSSSRRSPGSKGSEVHGASSRKTSKKLKHASTQKSRAKADGSEPLSENKRSKSLSASNHKSSRKAKDGSVSSHSKSSRKSKSRRESSRHKSSKKTSEEIPRTSSTLQASPEESQKTARELPDETAPTSQEK